MMPVADQEKYRQKRYDSWQPFCWSLFLFLVVTLVNISLIFTCQIKFYFLLILISPLDTPQNMINPVCSRRVEKNLKRFRINSFIKCYFLCTKNQCSASSCSEVGVTCFLFCFFKMPKFQTFWISQKKFTCSILFFVFLFFFLSSEVKGFLIRLLFICRVPYLIQVSPVYLHMQKLYYFYLLQ